MNKIVLGQATEIVDVLKVACPHCLETIDEIDVVFFIMTRTERYEKTVECSCGLKYVITYRDNNINIKLVEYNGPEVAETVLL